MPLTEDTPTTAAKIKAWAKIGDAADDAALADIVAAVDVVLRGLPVAADLPEVDEDNPAEIAWPLSVALGATMLGARLLRRRNSPEGVAAFAADGPVYIQRNDPDIAMMLELGDHAKPATG